MRHLKFNLATAVLLLITSTAVYANTDTVVSKDWLSTIIRDDNGKATACFTGTNAISGGLGQGHDTLTLFASSDPTFAAAFRTEMIDGITQALVIENTRDDQAHKSITGDISADFVFQEFNGTQYPLLAFGNSIPADYGFVTLNLQLRDYFLTALKETKVAALRRLDSQMLIWSMRGSTKAIEHFESCIAEISPSM